MEDYIDVDGSNVPMLADDSLLRVAEMAEKRIDAVIKIKQMALKVTNAGDWVDQNGKPYLMVSGAEKIGNLFNISWRIDEPTIETELDGHFTYTLKGVFSIPGRSISAEGSRSSKDKFFTKYDYSTGDKVAKPISAIDRRDVRMAALTNLLGNGITRLLGIRNLSYSDLEAFAGITQDQLGKVDYKSRKVIDKPPIGQPQQKQNQDKVPNVISENQGKRFYAIAKGAGKSDDDIKAYLSEKLGIDSSKLIPRDAYEQTCEEIKTYEKGTTQERQPGEDG